MSLDTGGSMTSDQDGAPTITVIAIDGPSGVGKGTIAQLIADRLSFHMLDSGAIYRLAALASIQKSVDISNESALVALANNLHIEFKPGVAGEGIQIFLEEQEVSKQIRTEAVAKQASLIAAIGSVRAALLQRQRDFARLPGLVADGRDMGTVVFPGAVAKFFLTASAQVRAQRRCDQLKAVNQCVNYQKVLSDIQDRDERDANREVAPLKPAADALVIDTSFMSIQQVEHTVLQGLSRLRIKLENDILS